MEKMLLKMARQLNAMDEASLMSLWDAYMARTQSFDGSREWEESAIVLSLIQAVRGKNQLLNAYLDLINNPEKAVPPRQPAELLFIDLFLFCFGHVARDGLDFCQCPLVKIVFAFLCCSLSI